MNLIICMGLFWVISSLHPPVAFSQDDILTVDDSAFLRHMRPAVKFPHQKHAVNKRIQACSACHHVYQNGVWVENGDSIGMECSECHYEEKQDAIMDLIRVYHLRCKGCHWEQKAGPVLCGECHRKD
jgi:hypothetical protein